MLLCITQVKESSLTNILDKALIDGSIAIGGLILLEILQGIKSEREYSKTRTALAEVATLSRTHDLRYLKPN